MQRSRYVKEVLLIANWRYMKGVPFLSLMVYKTKKGKGLDPGVEPPCIPPPTQEKIQ